MGREHDETRLSAEETEAIARLLADSVVIEEGAFASDFRPEPSGVGPGLGGGDAIVLRYDLVGGARRRHDDMPGLQLIHERFARELAGEFRRTVGQEGVFFAERLRHARFAEIYANLEVPTALIIASFTGLGCSIIVNMDLELMLHFLDVLMGGRGGKVTIPGDLSVRGFTPTEQGLITHLVAIISRALSTAWAEVASVSLEVIRVATDPRHAALYGPGESMVEQRVTVEWGEARGAIQLITPANYLRQHDVQLSRSAPPDKTRADPRDLERMRLNLDPIEVEIEATLGHAEMTVARLLNLHIGDIIRLDADPDQAVPVLVEGIPIFTGFPTVHRGNVAVKIAGRLSTAEDEKR